MSGSAPPCLQIHFGRVRREELGNRTPVYRGEQLLGHIVGTDNPCRQLRGGYGVAIDYYYSPSGGSRGEQLWRNLSGAKRGVLALLEREARGQIALPGFDVSA